MQKSRLIKQLKNLDQKELISLKKMLASPYFEKNPKCNLLFDIIIKYQPDYDHPDLDKEKVFALLFPNKKKMTSSLSTVMTGLLELINELKIQEELKQQQFHREHLLLNSLIKHGELDYFESTFNRAIKLLNNKTFKNISFYHLNYILLNDFSRFTHFKRDRVDKSHITKVIHSLDVFYISKKLNLTCELLNLQGIIQFDFEQDLLQNIDEIVEQDQYKQYPLIQLYNSGMKILKKTGENKKEIQDFIILLSSINVDQIENSELDELYTIAINQCIKKIIEGNTEYRTILFEIYKKLVDHGLLYRSGQVQLWRMKNIITLACQLGETEWAVDFNQQFKADIISKQRESAYNWHLAIIHFYKKDFEQTMEFLYKVDESDFFRTVNSKALLLKCYYELSFETAFYNHVKSYRAFIRQNKVLNAYWKAAYENFAKMAYQLFRKKQGFSNKDKDKLLAKINSQKQLTDKSWLLAKLTDLK